MTPAERKRHAAAILKLRAKRDRRDSGSQGYDPNRRVTYGATRKNAVSEGGCAPVDQMFEARRRSGHLPKGCWR